MARDYEKKKIQMRKYYRTQAGQEASKRSKETDAIRRGVAIKPLKVKPRALLDAIANWI